MNGFLYIMSNDSFKESLLKIGKSSRHPESFRKRELATTGVPGKFWVEYVVLLRTLMTMTKRHTNFLIKSGTAKIGNFSL